MQQYIFIVWALYGRKNKLMAPSMSDTHGKCNFLQRGFATFFKLLHYCVFNKLYAAKCPVRGKERAPTGRLWHIGRGYALYFTPTPLLFVALKFVVTHYFPIDNSQPAARSLMVPPHFTVICAYSDHKVTRFVASHAPLQRRHEATRPVQQYINGNV